MLVSMLGKAMWDQVGFSTFTMLYLFSKCKADERKLSTYLHGSGHFWPPPTKWRSSLAIISLQAFEII
jgi:hypothetical protein